MLLRTLFDKCHSVLRSTMQVNEKLWRNSTTAPLKTPESTVTIICLCDYVEDPYPEQNFITIRLYPFAPPNIRKCALSDSASFWCFRQLTAETPTPIFMTSIGLPVPQIMSFCVRMCFLWSRKRNFISRYHLNFGKQMTGLKNSGSKKS